MTFHELLNPGEGWQLGNGKLPVVDLECFPACKSAASNQGAACGKAHGFTETHIYTLSRTTMVLNSSVINHVIAAKHKTFILQDAYSQISRRRIRHQDLAL
jgi:hypothetical protein